MPCFSPSRCAPSPSRFCSAPPQLPWPYWFTLSAFRPSGRLSWCAACLDGARRCSVGGFAPSSSPSAISPPGSSRSSFPTRWRYRSRLLFVVARGARPHGGWRPSAIAQLQGFSSCSWAVVSHQWSSTRMTTSLVVERSEPGCGLPLPSASRMFISLAGVESEPSWGSASRMSWWPASSSSIWRKGMRTSLAREANFGYPMPTGPQALSTAELPAPRLRWSCPHPHRRAGERASLPWRSC
jgi:hypothetical protein